MNRSIPIIVFGAGSIGERHIINLLNLGYENIHVYRQRNLPFREVPENSVKIILDKDQIPGMNFEVALICTPSSQHLEQTMFCLQNNMHVFVEKPLSHNLEHFNELKELISSSNKCLHVAYMMRFHPLIIKIKKHIEENTFGGLLSFHTHWGSNLANWHYWENYQNSYAARKDLGGGVALTLSHDIDLVNWLVDSPVKSYSKEFSNYDMFNIDVESVADFLIHYENGVSGHVHLNYLEHVPKRRYDFIFENATLEFEFFNSELKILTKHNIEFIRVDNFDRNDLFISELRFFLDLIYNKDDFTQHSIEQIEESEVIVNMCSN